jgi:hypothetical protein
MQNTALNAFALSVAAENLRRRLSHAASSMEFAFLEYEYAAALASLRGAEMAADARRTDQHNAGRPTP